MPKAQVSADSDPDSDAQPSALKDDIGEPKVCCCNWQVGGDL